MNSKEVGRLSPLPWLYNKSPNTGKNRNSIENQFLTINKLNSSLKYRSNNRRTSQHSHKVPNNINKSKLKVNKIFWGLLLIKSKKKFMSNEKMFAFSNQINKS